MPKCMRFGHCGEMRRLGLNEQSRTRDCVPEMHRLGPNGAVPEFCKASWLCSACSRVDASAGICALEERSEGAEDAGSRAERHDRYVFLYNARGFGNPGKSTSRTGIARESFRIVVVAVAMSDTRAVDKSGLRWAIGSGGVRLFAVRRDFWELDERSRSLAEGDDRDDELTPETR